jgi:hypothetical protein
MINTLNIFKFYCNGFILLFDHYIRAVVPNLFRCEPHFRDFKIENAPLIQEKIRKYPLLPMQRYEMSLPKGAILNIKN